MSTKPKERPIGSKACSQCGVVSDFAEFVWNRREARLAARCNACRRAHYHEDPTKAKKRASEYYYANKDVIAEKSKAAYRTLSGLAQSLWSGAKKRAKERLVPFSITVDDIIIPAYCPVLGMELASGDGKCQFNSPTLDRIDPVKGYVPGNIVVVSLRANTIKNDATMDELAAVLAFYSQIALYVEGRRPALVPHEKVIPMLSVA